MMTRLLFLLLLLLVSEKTLSQSLPEIAPPSPEASSLSKFVEVPVSHYSGLPSINVPFYTIDLDGLQIPIGLSYHARGIRVEEIAPRVGIGWALNYGGMISRQTRGKLDDKNTSSSRGYLTQNYYDTFETNESVRIGVYNDDINDRADLVPDQFMFNFLGYSGKFIFDQKTKQPLLQNYSDFKIEPVYTVPNDYTKIKAWKITNEQGFKFYFGEYGTSGIIANLDETEWSYAYTTNGLQDLGSPSLNSHFNSWQLVAIESPQGNKVEFMYELESTQYHSRSYDKREISGTEISSYFSRIRSKEYKIKEITFNKGSVVFTKDSMEREDVNYGYSLKYIEIKDLDAATVLKYRLNYSYSYNNSSANINPSLLTYDPKAKKRLFLDSIERIAPGDLAQPYYSFEYIDKGSLPNRFSNSQDVWGYYNGKPNGHFLTFFDYSNTIVDRTVDTIKAQTGILKKIILPTGGSTEFEYEANQAKVPEYFKNLYFDGINPTYQKSVGMIKGLANYVGNKRYEVPFTIENDVFGNLRSVVQFMGDYGTCSSTQQLVDCKYRVSLQGVGSSHYGLIFMGENNYVAPPPGNYKIVVEQLTGVDDPNDFQNGFAVNISWKESLDDTKAIYSGGNRIRKTILNSDGNGTIEKSYEYLTTLNETSGLIYSLPSYYFIQRYVLGAPVLDAFGARPGSPNTYEQGNHVGYSHVTEYIDGNAIGDGGKTEYAFTSIPDVGNFYEHPYTISMDNEWMRGKLLSAKTYKKTPGPYELIREEQNVYNYGNTSSYGNITHPPLPQQGYMYYLKDNLQFHVPLIVFAPGNDPNPANWDHNDYKIYNLTGGTQHLHSNKVTSYYNALPVNTETVYYYDYVNHYQPNQSKISTSDSKPIITKTFYPEDVDSESYLGADNLTLAEKAAIDRLKSNDLHRFEPVQVETYKDEDEDGIADAAELLSRQRTNFREWGTDLILPEYIQSAKEEGALDNKIQFDGYYNNGNVKEVSKADGTHMVYIWGYNEQYPIAKIENATFAQVTAALSGLDPSYDTLSELQSLSNSDDDRCLDSVTVPCDEKNLRTALTALRTSLPEAMVTTYTYDPLIGVTSMTDPKGYTLYYEYDDLNRLEQIKDAEGNILSGNKYNYRLQNQ